MAESGSVFCTLCHEDDIASFASDWCNDCQEFLCTNCMQHHRRSKLSKHHQILTVDKYKEIPPFVLSIINQCEYHHEKFELYCSAHETLCCVHCLKNSHNKCTDLKPVKDAFENFRTGTAVSYLERDLKELDINFEEILGYTQNKSEDLSSHQSQGLSAIHSMRQAVNEHLDKIEQTYQEMTVSENEKMKNSFGEIIKTIEQRKKEATTIKNNLSNLLKYSTDVQMYIGLKKLEKGVAEEFRYLDNLVTGDQLCKPFIAFEPSCSLKSLATDINSFGQFSTSYKKPSLKVGKTTFDQQPQNLQIIDQNEKRFIRKCKLSLPQGLKAFNITGCVILPNGKLLFVDSNNKNLLLFNESGAYKRAFRFTSETPFDAVYVKNNIIAITHIERKLNFLDYETGMFVKTVLLEGQCYGISCDNELLFVRLPNNDLVLALDLEGALINRIWIQGKYSFYLAVHNGNILCTNENQNKIYCYDMDGKMQWINDTYTNYPLRGIAINSSGHIFVVCSNQYNEYQHLVILDHSGQNGKVLNLKDEVDQPSAIHIDKNKSLILICNYQSGLAVLFQVQK